MNKNNLYIAIAIIIGFGAGWLIFGNGSSDAMANKDISDMSDQHDHSGESADQMWTCSMHPQIMQPEAGDCPICGMDLIPADTGADGLAFSEIKMTENAMALANIQTNVIGGGKVDKNDGMIELSGKIAANEEASSVQASYFDGRIERLNVNYEGQKVNRGQLLAMIYAPNLVAAQQELITAANLKESQPALYKAVRNKLKNWKLTDKQIDAIEASGKVRDNFPVYATVSGTVSEVLAREGDYVDQGQPILKVSNLNTVWAEFDAYENQIAALKTGQKIDVFLNAYPDKEFNATVSFIDPILNNQTRTITVRATLNNTNDLFKPGMFVTGKIESATDYSDETLTIPASAVLWTGERSVVYVKSKPNEPVFEMREIQIGNRNGDSYTVLDGLQRGEEIVTNGTFTVDAAAQLQGKKSMMNQRMNTDTPTMAEMEMDFSEAFQQRFKKVINPYLQMKDAFVASDPEQVAKYALITKRSMESLNTNTLGKMEQAHLMTSIQMLEAITENESLENQRAHFVLLNENLVPVVSNLHGLNKTLYVQRCPMANNNKGAVWLSTEKDIRNPYFGDQMLSCGSVVDTLNMMPN
ncbi:MAG: efflux RND transporter periplasmic adaptor subunit [Flavobacteriales bacterium]|nr:efflux RND transporter periplasmic adaptor subunit [Flavobacteriales bacterium]